MGKSGWVGGSELVTSFLGTIFTGTDLTSCQAKHINLKDNGSTVVIWKSYYDDMALELLAVRFN